MFTIPLVKIENYTNEKINNYSEKKRNLIMRNDSLKSINESKRINNDSIVVINNSNKISNNSFEEKMKDSIRTILKNMIEGNLKDILVKKNEKNNKLSDELGFLHIKDKLKNPQLTKNYIKPKKEENLLKLIKDNLNTIQNHLNQVEKSIVRKRNTEENNRKNQINSNYMLRSNLEKTIAISKNLNSFKNQILDKFTKNLSDSINSNFNILSQRVFDIEQLNKKRLSHLESAKIEMETLNEKQKNCTNGKFILSTGNCI